MKSFGIKTQVWFKRNNYNLCDINAAGVYGNTALMQAAREGNVEIVKELIHLDAILDIKNDDGNTALWNACFGESYECFDALVKAGIDINSQNCSGVTVLMYSSCTGKEDFVEMLLNAGADTQIENIDGFKAIDLAVTPKIVSLLKNANAS